MKTNGLLKLVGLVLLIFITNSVFGQVRLPELFSDNMMFQRDRPIKVWGWASKGERIQVTFSNESYKTKADKNGNWEIEMQEMKAGGPHQLSVT